MIISNTAVQSLGAVEATAAHASAADAVETAAVAEFRAALKTTPRLSAHVPPVLTSGFVYSVTTIAKDAAHGGQRTVAVCDTWERAADIIRANEGDVWETTYHFAVIESTELNVLYGGFGERTQWWFCWDAAPDGDLMNGSYVPCESPSLFDRVQGFGIG